MAGWIINLKRRLSAPATRERSTRPDGLVTVQRMLSTEPAGPRGRRFRLRRTLPFAGVDESAFFLRLLMRPAPLPLMDIYFEIVRQKVIQTEIQATTRDKSQHATNPAAGTKLAI